MLSREMSLEEIEEVHQACPIQLESFVHGALCMSVSGQCLFSALLGGRSGNRGLCAQPCRLPFAAPGGTGHDLSLKDLSFVREIGQLKQAGVCSAKIEGRMKRPEYVAAAVSACRRAADGEEVPQALLDQLEAVFSRSGFTQGYLTGERGRAMFGVRRKEDVTQATEKVFASLRGLYRGGEPAGVRFSGLKSAGGGIAPHRPGWGRPPGCLHRAFGGGPLPAAPGAVRPAAAKDRGYAFPRGERSSAPGRGALRRVHPQRPAAGGLGHLAAPSGNRREAHPLPEDAAVLFRPFLPAGGAALAGPIPAGFPRCAPRPKRCREIVLPLETPLAQLERLREQGYPSVFLDIPRALFGEENRTVRKMEQCVQAGL